MPLLPSPCTGAQAHPLPGLPPFHHPQTFPHQISFVFNPILVSHSQWTWMNVGGLWATSTGNADPELHLRPAEPDAQRWGWGSTLRMTCPHDADATGLEDWQFLSSCCSEDSEKRLPPVGSELLKHHRAAALGVTLRSRRQGRMSAMTVAAGPTH